MNLLRVAVPVAAIAFLSACASVVSGTQKSLRVLSEPSGALVKLDGETRAITPAILHPSTRSDHDITVELAGYAPYHVRLTRRLSAWEVGNVATGIVPGIAFDAATGAIYKFQTDVINAKLRPLGSRVR
ncbi:MAG: hypothetical protein JWL59_2410 [Chthoniobacteraceae bacterium]|nr:hypothetical protein [Chthoniobacteraceae bacterium]